MCEPATLAMISTGLAIAGSVGQYMQAEDTAKRQDEMKRQNDANAARAYEIESRANTDRQIQEQEAAANNSVELQREYASKQATAINVGGEKGVTGLSLEGLLGDLGLQQAERQANVEHNTDMTLRQLQAEKEGQGVNMLNRINSVQKGTHPSVGSLAIGIGGNLIGGYTGYKQMQYYQKNGIGMGGKQ